MTEPAETPGASHATQPRTHINETYTFKFEIYEATKDSFSVGGNRYYVHDHTFRDGDRVKVSITHIPD